MKTLDELKSALDALLKGGMLRKLTLSRPSDPEILRTEGHLFEQKGALCLQLETFRKDGRATHLNFPADQGAEAVFDALSHYTQLNILSPLGDGEARLTKSGKWLVGGRIRLGEIGASDQPAPVIASHDHEKQYLLTEGEPYPFLIRLGICAPDGRVFDKKRPKFLQINKFLEQVEAVYSRLPRDGVLRVLDLCCGKSYLTFAVYHYLTVMKGRQVEMLGADLKSDVIAYCADTASRLGYDGLRFVCCDIGELAVPFTPDMVLSLHACDIATDIVLAKAIVTDARVILSTPCCHHQIMGQISSAPSPLTSLLSPVTDYSLLRQKLSDAITDGLRCRMLEACGYEVTVTELIDPEQTPKNLLIRATYRGVSDEVRDRLLNEYRALCTLGGLSPYLASVLEQYRAKSSE